MDSDLLEDLTEDEFNDLKKKIWPLMRKNPIEPMEILPFICNITEMDKEEINAASKYRGKMAAIDRLHEALMTRNANCFKSFLTALHDNESRDLWKKIIEMGKNSSSNKTSQSSRTRETQVNNIQKPIQQNSKYTEKIPFTRETEIGEISIKITDRWAAELNKNKLWRELSNKMDFKMNDVIKIEESVNAGEAFLNRLTKRRVKVVDLINDLEEEGFSNFLQVIRQDLSESDYNNLNIDFSPVDSASRFENVTLGLPRHNDSPNNFEENIQNNLMDSPPQSSKNLSEFRSSSSSSFNKTLKPENNIDSKKHGIEFVPLKGHNISFGSGKNSGQEEDQQLQIIPTLAFKSREGTEGSDISPIIIDSQKEIALANKKKELDSSYSDIPQMEASEQPPSLGADSAHQTCPKSTFLDEHLNTLGNLSMKPKELTSKRFIDQLSEENMRTSTQAVSQRESSRHREPVVHQGQDDAARQKGSSLMQGIRDIKNNLEQVGFEKDSYAARPSGSSINIPVQLASTATEVGNPIAAPESSTNTSSQFDLFQSEPGHQSAENLMGSRHMQGPYRSPVPVSDESDAKNLEMEASALREDMANQSNTVGYRDIQNSMPDQSLRSLENREYHSSVVNQFCYSEVERSQSQGQSNSSNVPTNVRETSDRSEGSSLGSMSNVLNNCPQLNDSLLNEETLTSNNNPL